MREMGFRYDPSTAGSSVRFDPPDARDPVSRTISLRSEDSKLIFITSLQPITFHKRTQSNLVPPSHLN